MDVLVSNPAECKRSIFKSLHQSLAAKEDLDLIVVCQDGRVHCHQLVIAALSPMCANALKDLSNDSATVIMPDVPVASVEHFVQSLYTGLTGEEAPWDATVAKLFCANVPVEVSVTNTHQENVNEPLEVSGASNQKESMNVLLSASVTRVGGVEVDYKVEENIMCEVEVNGEIQTSHLKCDAENEEEEEQKEDKVPIKKKRRVRKPVDGLSFSPFLPSGKERFPVEDNGYLSTSRVCHVCGLSLGDNAAMHVLHCRMAAWQCSCNLTFSTILDKRKHICLHHRFNAQAQRLIFAQINHRYSLTRSTKAPTAVSLSSKRSKPRSR